MRLLSVFLSVCLLLLIESTQFELISVHGAQNLIDTLCGMDRTVRHTASLQSNKIYVIQTKTLLCELGVVLMVIAFMVKTTTATMALSSIV